MDNGVPLTENTSHLQKAELAPFYHGVASGDPYQNSLVIWTRITPKFQMKKVPITWEVASDPDFKSIVKLGEFNTSPKRDYTVKVVVDGLRPGTTYYYRFKGLGRYSAIGTSKTLPKGDKTPVNLAFASCSNIEFGYFNAYAAMVKDELDAVIHLGDYIYEYGPNTYGDSTFFKKNIPPHEIISLQDYRDRYSQYRLDEDLQKVHGAFPFINVWDDHEITNNAYVSGAENHQDNEGSYEQRKAVAKQVFYEWLPIREGKNLYRKFQFGTTLELIMLDERLAGRTMQPDSINDPRRISPAHHLLGDTQMQWLIKSLKDSKAIWKIIGNQVIFSYSDWGHESFRQNMDAWDGYPNDQKTLTRAITANTIENLVFVTGDTHTAWAFEATSDPFDRYDRTTGEGAIGVEFGVTSISSGNANERSPDEEVRAHEKEILKPKFNPHLKYVNMRDHGYLKLMINSDEIIAEYKIVPGLSTRSPESVVDKTFTVQRGRQRLMEK
ncbi:MAG: alkaline phosphatase D family protein [Bacteroidota bacterium]